MALGLQPGKESELITVVTSHLQVEGPNKVGECYRVAKVIADGQINLRGLSAETIGSRFAVAIAFDNEQDADTAAKLLRSYDGKSK